MLKQIHPLIAAEIKTLPETWEVVKKRDHYFLHHKGKRVACVGNNSSARDDRQAKKSLHTIRRYRKNEHD